MTVSVPATPAEASISTRQRLTGVIKHVIPESASEGREDRRPTTDLVLDSCLCSKCRHLPVSHRCLVKRVGLRVCRSSSVTMRPSCIIESAIAPVYAVFWFQLSVYRATPTTPDDADLVPNPHLASGSRTSPGICS